MEKDVKFSSRDLTEICVTSFYNKSVVKKPVLNFVIEFNYAMLWCYNMVKY